MTLITYRLSSESNSTIFKKEQLPTPTMMIDMGRREALMIAFFVSVISVMSPSVSISNTK